MPKTSLRLLFATITASLINYPSHAQQLEEVVVTAGKREQTLQDVPIAVTVVSNETLEMAQIRDLIDLQTVATSLRVEQRANSQNTNFFIRGFGNGDNNPGIEPSVGVFIDGVYRSRSAAQIADLPNIERIEVLRGPQSTLFGKNASAGVVSVVTRKPQFEWGGSASLNYGNYNSIVAKGDISGPLSDTIAFGLSGSINQRDGYFDVVDLGIESNDRDRWEIRADLLFEPTENLTVRLIADTSSLEEICCGGANVIYGPTGPLIDALAGGTGLDAEAPFSFDLYQDFASDNEIDNSGVSLQIDYSFNSLTLTSITAFREVDAYYRDDQDFSGADIVSAEDGQGTLIDTFTQELRLTSNLDGPFNFLIGAFFFDEDIDYNAELLYGTQFRPYGDALLQGATGGALNLDALESIFGVPSGTFFAPGTGMVREDYQLSNTAVSVFGNIDIDLSDRLVLSLGLSYVEDEKEFNTDLVSNDVFSAIELPPALDPLTGFQFIPQFLNVPNEVETAETNDDDWTYSFRLAYDLNDNVNIYGTWATGFKASSVNLSRDSRPLASDLPAIIAAGIQTPNLTAGSRFAEPENSEVLEFGLKANFASASVNIAIFDQTIEDFQSNVFTGTGFALANAEEQSTFGVEFEGNYSATDALDLFLSVTYLDPEYDSFSNSAFGDLSGETPANIPEWAVSAGGTYTHSLSNGDDVIVRVNYFYEDEVRLRDGYAELPQEIGDGITRQVRELSASLTWILTSGFELSAWGRNLLDEEYLVGAFDSTAQPGSVTGYPNQPRTYGLTGRYKF